jgi:hypothetical protein
VETFFYSEVSLRGLTLSDAENCYLNWVLGIHEYKNKRKSRLDLGIDEQVTPQGLIKYRDTETIYDAQIKVRTNDSRFLLQFRHRDKDRKAVFWNNFVEIEKTGQTLRVRHSVGQSYPKDDSPIVATGTPTVITELIRRAKGNVTPKEFLESPLSKLSEEGLSDWLQYSLFDSERALPFVLVVPTTDGKYLVNAEEISKKLVGISRVFTLPDTASTYRLSELCKKNFKDEKFSCYDGGVRLYKKGLKKGDTPFRHPIWFRKELESAGIEPSTARVAFEISQEVSEESLPAGFNFLIHRFDQDVSRNAANSTIRGLENKSLEEQNAELQAQLQEALQVQQMALEENDSLYREARTRKEAFDVLFQEKKYFEEESVTLLAALKKHKSSKKALDEEETEALRACQTRQKMTPKKILAAYGILRADRVHIHENALQTAAEVDGFAHPEKLLELVEKLCGPYWEQMCEGKGDVEAGKVFGKDRFGVTENAETLNKPLARKSREYEWGGEVRLADRHLKIGNKDSVYETLRLYFDWHGSERKIIIYKCGEHAPI